MKLTRVLLFAFVIGAVVFGQADDEVTEEGTATETVATTFSEEDKAVLKDSEETFQFQAEVNRLMDIIINSLYSNREIFLRELISNAADALDKIRFRGLTDPSLLGTGEQAELDIKIEFDKEAKTLTLTDKGVGMTKKELISNLGVVAKSGTTEFVEAAASSTDSLSLIGQFGVGFYSVYLVSDKVTVISKSNDDDQYVWESTANSVFTVAKDPRGNTLGRGTSIILQLKEDAEEFLQESELEKIISRYSEFINFPIYLKVTKTVEEEVPIEEEENTDETKEETETETETEEDLEVTEEEDDEKDEEKPTTKTVKKEVEEWKLINTVKAIWTRNPKEITDEEYTSFYQSLSKDTEEPLDKVHFVAEGEITFRSILYIPSKAATGLYDKFYEKSTSLKLYVRRVLISDSFDDFLPKYLNFIKGVVDSEDLPLNVSRETLAQSRVLKVMSKKLTRKVLELLKKLATASEEADEDEDDEEEEEADEEDSTEETEKKDEKEDPYMKFWEQFGKSVKLGVIDDRKNKSKLSKLLRYTTTKSDGKFVSLESYVDRMKENQKNIYYITCETMDQCKASPLIERLVKKDLEVIYMPDPLDEYVVQTLTEFDGNTLQSVSKDGLTLDDDEDTFKALEEEFKDLTEWMKTTYGSKVEKVKISNRIATSPCILVSGQYGWSANMERIMKAQTLGDATKQTWMHAKKTMEINPRHPIMLELKSRVAADADDVKLADLATLLYDGAVVASGFAMADTAEFAARITRVVSAGLDVDPDQEIEEEVFVTPKTESEEEEEETEEATEEPTETEEATEDATETEEATEAEEPSKDEL